MIQKLRYIIPAAVCLLLISWAIPFEQEESDTRSERVKIALRQVGNELLLSNQDSTSMIMPVVQIDSLKYKLTFEGKLTFLPDSLVSIVDANFAKAGLSKNYIVEVVRCEDQEVSYSFEMSSHQEKTIIPCKGRRVPDACHTIEVLFLQKPASLSGNKMIVASLAVGMFLFLTFRFSKNKRDNLNEDSHFKNPPSAIDDSISLGSFQFHQKQNKLVFDDTEIVLSNKECELLSIFANRPNEIIKREELTKTVWEDHGVIVGRSLDTYISKLRKKLKNDSSLKITNVHGVGYRLDK